MKILMSISAKLNRANSVLEPVGRLNELTVRSFETIRKSTRTVEKRLKNLDYLNKVLEITSKPTEKSKLK
jgi:hypothetical protein